MDAAGRALRRPLRQGQAGIHAARDTSAYLPGRIGHGLGLGAHEHPSLDARSTITLEPGMLITFEPNLRIPEWGGLQHSDSVLITAEGNEFLTTTRRGYIEV